MRDHVGENAVIAATGRTFGDAQPRCHHARGVGRHTRERCAEPGGAGSARRQQTFGPEKKLNFVNGEGCRRHAPVGTLPTATARCTFRESGVLAAGDVLDAD